MNRLSRLRLAPLLLLLLLLPAYAENDPDRTQVGDDIHVRQGESVGDLTCFNCSIYVSGKVAGDVTTFHGRILLEDNAQVAGDVTAFLGDVRLESGTNVAGDLTTFGGTLHRGTATQVAGDVSEFRGAGWVILIFGLPLLFLGGIVALIVWLLQRNQRPAAAPARA
jgi:hypothetical protein